ncbi:MAG: septum formation protein Maf [Deltaproteobacteria bacterium]|nr:septum formation protein Maf [Deltaproteobacteria bacterium]
MRIVLASTSETRQKILSLLNVHFTIAAPLFEEDSESHLSPPEEASLFAKQKALSLADQFKNALILACDTLVDLNHHKIGKPTDFNHAREILKSLAGQTLLIHTGLYILDTKINEGLAHLQTTQVTMKNYDDATLEEYLQKTNPLDKAGACTLEGPGEMLIASVKGDFLSAMGLPLQKVAEILKQKKISFNAGFLNHYPTLHNF